MPYLDGFQNDVFISYTHVDDWPARPDVPGEKGWVERFASRLKVALFKQVGEKVEVWRDPALKRSDRFEPKIESAVRGSAVFLSLLSRRYLKSEYCLKEADWFVDTARGSALGLDVSDQSRIFPVLLYNLPFNQWPEPCRGLSGFPFHDATDDRLGKPADPEVKSDRFDAEFARLVEEVGTLLEAIRESQAPAEPTAALDFGVYLAATSDNLRSEKGRLARSLRNAGVRVLGNDPPVPPPYGRDKHAVAVRAAVAQANLSVHLLDRLAGSPLEGAPDTSYPQEQVRIALEHAPAQLVVLPEFFALEEVEEATHRDFLRDLQAGGLPGLSPGDSLEVAQARTAQVFDLIAERRHRLAAQQAAGTNGGSVFLDLHPRDLAAVGRLVELLGERHLTPLTMPSAELSPTDGDKLFEQNVARVSALLIVFGQVGRDWVKSRLERALQLIVRHDLPLRPVVWAAPPAKPPADLEFRFCEVVDSTARFDAEAILRILPPAAGAPT